MKREVKSSIVLTELESKIQKVLVEYCDFYNSQDGINEDQFLELRITGGWVRDKLLGIESNDIDIAINHLTGEDFASNLHDYLKEHNPELHLKAIHTIKKNPEKSKHLETCTTKLFGIDIDFVNLRSEEYTDSSRVPIIKFGSPLDDALRRDATLNSLFFNLNKNTIEDFTGKGMDDLKNGVLRTPLEPLQTFLDDPLRVLRLIRFASRFDFLVEAETLAAMKNSELKKALTSKISRERVDIELQKIFTSRNPSYGLQLMNYAELFPSIFDSRELLKEGIKGLEDEVDIATQHIGKQVAVATTIFPIFRNIVETELARDSKFSQLLTTIGQSHDFLNTFWLSIILFPFRGLNESRGQKVPVVKQLMRFGLKSKKSDIDIVGAVTTEYVTSRDVLEKMLDDPHSVKRSELGLYLRKFPGFSSVNILFNCIIDITRPYIESGLPTLHPNPLIPDELLRKASVRSLVKETITKYELLLNAVDAQGLSEAHKIRPIVDGTTLSKTFDRKPGPWIKLVTDEIIVWQLDNPSKSNEECLAYVTEILPKYVK
ncbi:uncharacterized protein RJT20DRAFT_1302 [Scheffersomyces xylosifermentans]|uniref:uncharacterized protein n=1 Tax=Scheffersomyces xylosifermentans TaxID=1304137 RepID=UPI00315D86CD